jgi:hypothetical protein
MIDKILVQLVIIVGDSLVKFVGCIFPNESVPEPSGNIPPFAANIPVGSFSIKI